MMSCTYKRLTSLIFALFAGSTLASSQALASPSTTTYQAKIIRPDNSALEDSSVNFKFTILDKNGTCVIYSNINMANTGGLITFTLGSGIRSFPTSGTITFAKVFDNAQINLPCESGSTYSPTSTDNRKVIMQFHDSIGWQTTPAMAINAVPYSMYAGLADDSSKLNGLADTAFVKAATIPTCNSANQALQYTGSGFTCVTIAGGGGGGGTVVSVSGTATEITSTGGISPQLGLASVGTAGTYVKVTTDSKGRVVSGSTSLLASDISSALGYTPANSASAASGTVTQVTSGNSYIVIVSGTTTPVVTLNVGTSANTVAAGNDSRITGALQAANNLSDLASSSTARTSLGLGTLATKSNVDLGTADATGTLAVARLPSFSGDATSVSGSNVLTLNNSGVVANTYGSSSTVGVFTVDSKGRITSATNVSLSALGAVAGITAAATAGNPIVIGGTSSNPTVDITNATSSTAGYLSAADFTTFNNKLGPATNFFGDISGNYNSVSVNAIKGVSVTLTALANNNILQYNGSAFVNRAIPTCAANEYLTFDGTNYTCAVDSGSAGTVATVVGTAGQITSTGSATITLSLTDVVSSATVGSANAIPSFTFDSKGRVTAATSNAYQDANGAAKGIVQIGPNITVSTGVISVTSANVISALGFTPANNAAVSGALIATNNLSDVVSASAARSNLGLGNISLLNIIDLATNITGILPDANIANIGSGIASGTQYTKVTVDGKGRVTSGAQLSASDVTSALGFTPTAATSSVTSLNGSTSATQTFAVTTTGTNFGINTAAGVHTFNIPFAASSTVTAGLLSNADYTAFSNKLSTALASGSIYVGNSTGSATAVALSGDVTLSNAGVLSLNSVGAGVTSGAQYTKVTVDGKGRVTSGAQLISSDITTALGFTPANTASATQWTTNGNNIYYNTGNVGIGTSSPSSALQVVTSGTMASFDRIAGTSTLNVRRANGTVGALTVLASGDEIGRLGAAGYTGSGSGYSSTAASVRFYGEEAFTANNNGTNIRFYTTPLASSATAEVARFTSAGYFGLGTTSPNANLDVSGTSIFRGIASLLPYGTAAGNTSDLRFNELAANGSNYVALKAADNLTANISFTLPSVSGTTGQVLTTDGAGILTWSTVSGGGGAGTVSSVTGTAGQITVVSSTTTPVISLANSGVTSATYGSASQTARFAVDSTGRLSSATTIAIAIDASQITAGALSLARGGTGGTTSTTARTSLGLGTIATYNQGNSTGTVPVLGVTGLTANKFCVASSDGLSVNCNTDSPVSGSAISGISFTDSTPNSSIFIDGNKSGTSFGSATGSENVGIGYNVLQQTIDTGGGYFEGHWNVGVGSNALMSNTTGMSNVGIGAYSLYSEVSGTANVAVGTDSSSNFLSGENNTTIGNGSMYNFTLGSRNTVVGASAGKNITAGSHNILIGYEAGVNLTEGSGNIFIGDGTTGPSATTDDLLNINNIIYGELDSSSSQRIGIGIQPSLFEDTGDKLSISGNLRIHATLRNDRGAISLGEGAFDGTAMAFHGSNTGDYSTIAVNEALTFTKDFANYQVAGASRYRVDYLGNTNQSGNISAVSATLTGTLQVGSGSLAASSTVATFQNATGTCSIKPNMSTLSCSSDIRLKRDIASIPGLEALDKVLALNAKTYVWKNSDDEGRHIGYIAQEVEKVVPELVTTDERGFKQVGYSGFVPLITEAIKQLYSYFYIHNDKIKQLEAQNVKLIESEKLKDQKIKDLEEKAKQIDAMKSYLCSKDPAAPICK